jgi:hypothetical protein
MTNQLFINGKSVDLSDETKIGITKQVNNFGDLTSRQGDFSNTFKIPKTIKNRTIFENSENTNSATLFPYKKHLVDYFEDGIQIVFNGSGTLVNDDEKFYNFKINSGNTSFFDETINQSVGRLYDVDRETLFAFQTDKELGARGLAVQWFIDDVISARDGSQFYIFPVIDNKENFNQLTNGVFDVRRTLPFLFIKDIFERQEIVTQYKLKGSFIDSNIYPKLILSSDSMDYKKSIIDGTEAPIPELQVFPTLEMFTQLGFGIYGGSGAYSVTLPNTGIGTGQGFVYYFDYSSSDSFLVDFNEVSLDEPNVDSIGFKGTLTFEATGEILFETSGGSPSIQYGLAVEVYNTTTNEMIYQEWLLDKADDNYIGSAFAFNHFFNIEGVFHPSHKFKVNFKVKVQEDDLHDISFTLYSASSFSDKPFFAYVNVNIETPIQYGNVIFFNQIFNVPRKNVFKDVLNMFYLIAQTNELTRETYLNFFDDIIENIPNALDWSDKVDTRKKNQTFDFGKFGARNVFRYKENEFVPKDFGNGTIEIEGVETSKEQVLIDLNSSATDSRTIDFESLVVPQIRTYKSDGNTNKTNNRILIADIQDTAFDIEFSDSFASSNFSTNIPFARFLDPAKEENLDFPSLIPKHFKAIKRILRNPKKIVLQMKLNSIDIKNLNFIIPIKLDVQENEIFVQGHFFISRINAYKNGSASVEFIRL